MIFPRSSATVQSSRLESESKLFPSGACPTQQLSRSPTQFTVPQTFPALGSQGKATGQASEGLGKHALSPTWERLQLPLLFRARSDLRHPNNVSHRKGQEMLSLKKIWFF